MVKSVNIISFITFLILITGCDPSPTSGIKYEISGVEWQFVEAKKSYAVGDIDTLQLSVSPDFEKFESYRLRVKVYNEDESKLLQDSVLIKFKENDYTNRELLIDNSYVVSDSKLNLNFKLEMLKEGKYRLSSYLIGNLKKKSNDSSLPPKFDQI